MLVKPGTKRRAEKSLPPIKTLITVLETQRRTMEGCEGFISALKQRLKFLKIPSQGIL